MDAVSRQIKRPRTPKPALQDKAVNFENAPAGDWRYGRSRRSRWRSQGKTSLFEKAAHRLTAGPGRESPRLPRSQPASEQLRQHAGGADRPVGLHGLASPRRLQSVHHGVGDHVRRRRPELHASSGSIAVETMRDVKILLEMVLQRKI